jgi:anti-sigma regulatory factor (Ser/Thr protein kinase)
MVEREEASGRPDRARRLDLCVEARPENVSRVRRALERLDIPMALMDDAKLLATELVTNSIPHSGLRPDQVVHLTAHWSGRTLRVIVRDRANGAGPPAVAGSIRPSPGAESGWGLFFFLDRIATRWGTDGRAGYWFELDPPTERA